MPFAQIGPIAIHFPDRLETNAQLQQEFPDWDIPLIEEKTGIASRWIAAENETATDLAVAAAQKLFSENQIDPKSIDYVMLCTQTPDYVLPTSACLVQDRLGIPTHAGALDFNLGCSGFVYGLSLADGLIQSGQAKRILLITSETYSKYIDREDRSLRTIFGDAAAATLVIASEVRSLTDFRFGTDGSGADTLIVADGGSRSKEQAIRPRHRKRWKSRLYMDGPSLLNFAMGAIPNLIEEILGKSQTRFEDIDLFLFHQATSKMLQQLQIRLGLNDAKLPIRIRDIGNTVSCTLPILIRQMRDSGELHSGLSTMMVGFGVGWSWAGCLWQDTFASKAIVHTTGPGAIFRDDS